MIVSSFFQCNDWPVRPATAVLGQVGVDKLFPIANSVFKAVSVGDCAIPDHTHEEGTFIVKVEPILPSEPESRLFKSLSRKYPHVFPCLHAGTFLVEETILHKLEPVERRMLPYMPFSIVCTDDKFMAKLAVHYAGEDRSERIAEARGDLQEKLCAMAGVEFWRIRTDDQLREVCAALE
ncbi:MAG: hypothetical protein AAF471_08145 [Myxococcota bacterium]